jgi:Tfp pilus assembly protein PilX
VTTSAQRGTTLVVGLILLSLVTLLGLAGAGTAHVERLLAQNAAFRENAASAASAGLEHAISNIVTLCASLADPATAALPRADLMPGSTDRLDGSF